MKCYCNCSGIQNKDTLLSLISEEAASDEKKGKLYKPKSRFETQPKSILPLETPSQFLPLDKRHVSSITGDKKPVITALGSNALFLVC